VHAAAAVQHHSAQLAGILLTTLAETQPIYLRFTEFPQWVNPHFGNFDDILWALLLLFEVSALEGWPSVLFTAMDSDNKELFVLPWKWHKAAPFGSSDGIVGANGYLNEHTPNRYFAATYMILWIVLGCFVVMNMTIGVVVDQYSKIRDENDGCALMTDDQSEWVKAQKQVFAMRPLRQAVPPANRCRQRVFDVVTSTKFDVLIMAFIVANMIVMALDLHNPAWGPGPDGKGGITTLNDFIWGMNILFFCVYIVEMILKLIGLGIKQYFQDGWNDFDFVLVMLGVLDLALGGYSATSNSEVPFPPSLIRVLRLFRVVRILRIIKTAKKLRTIIMTVVISIPALLNIGMLILLILFIYAVWCIEIFAKVNYTPGNWGEQSPESWGSGGGTMAPGLGRKFNSDFYYSPGASNYGDYINRHANFENFGMALLTLARCVTGESFNGIMHDLMAWEWGDNRLRCCPSCGPIIDGEDTDSCGDTLFALITFLTFQMIMAYIVLSLAIGVILENFANVGSETKKITMEQLEEFREVWLKYDPKGTFVVPSHNLLAILQQLRKPLGIVGVEPAMTRSEMLKHLGKLDVPDHGGFIHFMETLTAVSHNHAGVPVPLCDTTKKIARLATRVPGISKLEKPAHNALTNYLVSLLQSRWRGYAMRKRYEDDDGEYDDAGVPELSADHQQPMPDDPGVGAGKVKANQVAPAP